MNEPFLLFDLDGTLSDPLDGIARSFNHALSFYGYEELPVSEITQYIGPPLDESFKTITGKDDISAFISTYRECYFDVGFKENTLYPGITETLAELSNRGIPMAICTSKRQDIAEKILDLFGLEHHFRFVSGGDAGIQKWQQIESLLERGLIDKNVIMIGDRAVDLTAAHKNGLPSAGVLWGYGSRSELEAESPRYVLSHPPELLRLIDGCGLRG